MRLNVTPFCQLVGAMQVHSPKTTRGDDIAPEIKWATGKTLCIIGFDDFTYPVRFSIARLNGEDCNLLSDDSTGFYTEVPSVGYFGDLVGDTTITIDTDPSRNHLQVYTDCFAYKVGKIQHNDSLDFRRQYLPLEPIAEGRIQQQKLLQCIKLSPDETLHLVLADGSARFVSESIDERVECAPTDVDTIPSESVQSSYAFDVEALSEPVKNITKKKQVQFSVAEEFIRLRYRLGENGYMNYYQRTKTRSDVYVI
jgi:hypothetical protein